MADEKKNTINKRNPSTEYFSYDKPTSVKNIQNSILKFSPKNNSNDGKEG